MPIGSHTETGDPVPVHGLSSPTTPLKLETKSETIESGYSIPQTTNQHRHALLLAPHQQSSTPRTRPSLKRPAFPLPGRQPPEREPGKPCRQRTYPTQPRPIFSNQRQPSYPPFKRTHHLSPNPTYCPNRPTHFLPLPPAAAAQRPRAGVGRPPTSPLPARTKKPSPLLRQDHLPRSSSTLGVTSLYSGEPNRGSLDLTRIANSRTLSNENCPRTTGYAHPPPPQNQRSPKSRPLRLN